MRRFILVLATVGGMVAAVVGTGLGSAVFVLLASGRAGDGLQAGASQLSAGTLALGIIMMSLGLGLVLAWNGWRGLAGAPGRPFRLPGWGWWLLAFISTLAVGYALFSAGLTAPVALVHVAASAAAAFLVLALAVGGARRGGAEAPARATAGSLAWGGLGAAGLAVTTEALVALMAVLVISVWLTTARPDLLEQLRAWAAALQGGSPGDLGELGSLLRSPWAIATVLGFAGVLVPLMEEAAKGLAVPLVAASGRRLRRVDAYLLGAAAGAGFALIEGVLNGALGLASPITWASAMLLRGAAATMHCAASALAGLGWHAIIAGRQWLLGLCLGLLAVMLHGAWNSAAVGVAASALVGGGNLVTLLFVGYLGGLWVLAALSLALLPRWLARIDAI